MMDVQSKSELVHSFLGTQEWRHVIDVDEWTIELSTDSKSIVMTLMLCDELHQTYRISCADAQDLSAILTRLTTGL